MDELILKARAVELLRAEKQKARKRKACVLFCGGVAIGVSLTILFLHLFWHHPIL